MVPHRGPDDRVLGGVLSDLTQFFLAGEREAIRAADDAALEQQRRIQRILEGQNPASVPFVLDESPYIGLRCPRRASKSFSAASKAVYKGETRPGSRVLILSITLKSTKENYWSSSPSGIFRMDSLFGLGLRYHHTDLVWHHQNGSRGRLAGVETKADIEYLRGAAAEADLAIIDECKSIAPGLLEELIRDVLEPGMMTRNGQIVLAGTPGLLPYGPFYEATCEAARNTAGAPTCRRADEPRVYQVPETLGSVPAERDDEEEAPDEPWVLHTWTVRDNVKVPGQWSRALRIKRRAGWADDHPTWRREFLGEWVQGSEGLVYAFGELRSTHPERVLWYPERDSRNPTGLPPEDGPWHLVMGLDFGFEDDTGLVLAAYSERLAEMRHVYDYKAPHLLPDQVAALVEETVARFGRPEAIVGDAGALGGKVYVETLGQRHGIHVEKANKVDKLDHIEFLNSDFHSGRVKVIPGSDLDHELCGLQWNLSKDSKANLARAGKLREDPGCPNHLCFVPGTLVTTRRGPVPIEDVVAGDEVLTHRGRYRKVRSPLSRHYAGRLVTVATPAGEVTCTPEHEMYSAPVHRSPGKRLRVGDFAWTPAEALDGRAVAVGRLVEGAEADPHRALALGYWGAEGSVSHRAGVVSWCGHRDEDGILPFLEKGLRDWGAGERSRTRRGRKCLRISKSGNLRRADFSSREMVEYLRAYGCSDRKRLPDEVMGYGPVAALHCLAGYLYGDGHITKNGRVTVAGVSEAMMKQVAHLARTSGVPCSVRFQRRAGRWAGFGSRALDQWVVGMAWDELHARLAGYPELLAAFRDKTNFREPARERAAPPRTRGDVMFHTQTDVTDAGHYEGPVHTLDVEDDHSYVVDGLVAKNCDALLYLHRFSYHFFARDRAEAPRTPEQRAKDAEARIANRRASRLFAADGYPGRGERPVTRDSLLLHSALARALRR